MAHKGNASLSTDLNRGHSRLHLTPYAQRMVHRPVLGLDADDTLWENQARFDTAQGAFRQLLSPWATGEQVDASLLSLERTNIERYGYGVKSFTLSCVEAAINLTEGTIEAHQISQILSTGQALIDHPVELLPTVADTLHLLGESHRLMLITKGDPTDQHRKILNSGIVDHFWAVEVVREKDPHTYGVLLQQHRVEVDQFTMVGNSVPSDVLPVISLGAQAVHIPHHTTWGHEHADDASLVGVDFPVLDSFSELPALLAGRFLA